MNDLIAYAGTILLLTATPLKRRFHLHLLRIVGNILWLWYAILIWNMPLIVADFIALVLDTYGAIKFRKQ
jgi:hypothetical protein